MSGTIGRVVVAVALIFGIWGAFYNDIEIVLFQKYLDDGSVVDRIDHCGSIYDVMTGQLGESITGRIAADNCVKAARTDATFGGLLVAFFATIGVGMILSSHRTPLILMDQVRPLPASSVFWRRQEAHQRRAAELANHDEDD